jgi:hypothetical protein
VTGNGFVGLTPAEAEADLQAAAARIRLAANRPPATAAERLRDAHRCSVEANTRVALAERELAEATAAATNEAIALEQAKQHLIDDTLSLYYGTHR